MIKEAETRENWLTIRPSLSSCTRSSGLCTASITLCVNPLILTNCQIWFCWSGVMPETLSRGELLKLLVYTLRYYVSTLPKTENGFLSVCLWFWLCQMKIAINCGDVILTIPITSRRYILNETVWKVLYITWKGIFLMLVYLRLVV